MYSILVAIGLRQRIPASNAARGGSVIVPQAASKERNSEAATSFEEQLNTDSTNISPNSLSRPSFTLFEVVARLIFKSYLRLERICPRPLTMNLLYWSLGFFLSISSTTHAYEPKETAVPEPCTIRSPHTGSFFDLKSLHIPDPKTIKSSKDPRDYSWNATGWDMGYNFTMNFCGGVVENLKNMGGVEGVEQDLWRNVSAYYQQGGKVYSIG